MDYQKAYDILIQRGISRASTRSEAKEILGGYCEKHHIIPKCIGGSNQDDNLVYISAREHYIAHQLLVKIYPGNKKLSYACVSMTWDKYGHRINNRIYEWVKKQHARNVSNSRKGKNKQNDKGVAIQAAQLEGRTADNDPGRAEAARKMEGRTRDNHTGVASASKKRTGRTKNDHSGVATTAVRLTGRIKIPEEINFKIYHMRKEGMSRQDIQNWISSQGFFACHQTITSICRRIEKTYLNELSENL